MNAIKIIAYIAAAILIFFGILFIYATFSPNGSVGWLVVGTISVLIGFVLIFWAARKPAIGSDQNVVLKIDLPANVSMDTMKCKSCGGVLSTENITLVAGAPIVTCPFCKTTYQLTEEPKW